MSNDSCAINTLLNDLREIGLNDDDEKILIRLIKNANANYLKGDFVQAYTSYSCACVLINSNSVANYDNDIKKKNHKMSRQLHKGIKNQGQVYCCKRYGKWWQ